MIMQVVLNRVKRARRGSVTAGNIIQLRGFGYKASRFPQNIQQRSTSMIDIPSRGLCLRVCDAEEATACGLVRGGGSTL
jgi:hypothetical protein